MVRGSTLRAIVDADAGDDGEMLIDERVADPAELALGELVFDGTLLRVDEGDEPERVFALGLRERPLLIEDEDFLVGENRADALVDGFAFVVDGVGNHGRLLVCGLVERK